jgi:hypothetical protein
MRYEDDYKVELIPTLPDFNCSRAWMVGPKPVRDGTWADVDVGFVEGSWASRQETEEQLTH